MNKNPLIKILFSFSIVVNIGLILFLGYLFIVPNQYSQESNVDENTSEHVVLAQNANNFFSTIFIKIGSIFEKKVFISVSEGIEYSKPHSPSILIPPDSISNDTDLIIKQAKAPDNSPELIPISEAYDISLEEGNLRESIEIALPIVNKNVSEHENYFIAYYDESLGWISLPSWYSEEDMKVHALTSHFTIFKAFTSLLPIKPKITYFQVYPNPIQGVGNPPCFRDPINLSIEAKDPNGEIETAIMQIRMHSSNSESLTDMSSFGQSIFALGLVMTSGGPTALLPAAHAALTLTSTSDPGIVISKKVDIPISSEKQVVINSQLDLTQISYCGDESFNADRIMNGLGIKSIDIIIWITDNSGQTIEEKINIPILINRAPYAELLSPGPRVDSIQPSKPIFQWQILQPSTFFEQTLYYAKGDTLWDRWFVPEKKFDMFTGDWQPDYDLSPGKYVWGVEVKSKEGTTRSTVHHFTVPKYWIDLTINGEIVSRSILANSLDIHWVVTRDGEKILARNANNETNLDLRRIYGGTLKDGLYKVFIEGVYSSEYHVISNSVGFQVFPTPTPTSTATPTPTPTPTPTSTPTPTITPTSTNTPTPVPTKTRTPIPYANLTVINNFYQAQTVYVDGSFFATMQPGTSVTKRVLFGTHSIQLCSTGDYSSINCGNSITIYINTYNYSFTIHS